MCARTIYQQAEPLFRHCSAQRRKRFPLNGGGGRPVACYRRHRRAVHPAGQRPVRQRARPGSLLGLKHSRTRRICWPSCLACAVLVDFTAPYVQGGDVFSVRVQPLLGGRPVHGAVVDETDSTYAVSATADGPTLTRPYQAEQKEFSRPFRLRKAIFA